MSQNRLLVLNINIFHSLWARSVVYTLCNLVRRLPSPQLQLSHDSMNRVSIETRGWNVFIRLLFIVLGTLFLLVGILGLLLPLLPATPFLLLASACYVRGSPTLHRWLMSHRYLGAYITTIKERRGMPLQAKVLTIAVLWASLLFSASRLDSWLLEVILLMVGIGVTTLLIQLKTVGQR